MPFLKTARLTLRAPNHSKKIHWYVPCSTHLFTMENAVEMGKQSRPMKSLPNEAEFSIYPLRELFKARYWVDAKSDLTRGRYLENEIQHRCAHIRERINCRLSAAAELGNRFRPYGFISGAIFLSCSIGPFVAVKFLDLINLIHDFNGDQLTLSGVWALVTLPFAVLAFMIGGIMDAGRVVKWFDLAGRQGPENGPDHSLAPRPSIF
jgi:hypothetical protein